MSSKKKSRSAGPGAGKGSSNAADVELVAPAGAPAGAVCIDASQLEGGGQILRNAVALSAITGKSIHVDKIRAGRRNPGLSAQHLTGLRLVESICNGQLEGGAIRSTAINFIPGMSAAGAYTADTKTAGSCTLMVQQAMPCLLFAAQPPESTQSSLTLRGGTDASYAPPIGYLQHVLLPTLQRLLGPAGAGLDLKLKRRGFYPKGGGEAVLRVPSLPHGQALPAWGLTQRGHLTRIDGYVFVAGRVRKDVGQRIANAAADDIKQALKDPAVVFGGASSSSSGHGSPSSAGQAGGVCSVVVDMQVVEEPPERAVGDGGGVVLVAQTSSGCLMGSSALAERGVTAEAVGAMAARDLLEVLRSGAAVDDWMQDQLIVFMALAGGTSSMLCNELTLHTRTAIEVVQQLLPEVKFSITKPAGDQLYLVTCAGAELQR